MREIEKHQRVHEPITGPAERRILAWLAARTPERYGPDTLTVIGIIGSVITFVGYALCHVDAAFLWMASFGFVVNWFGDSLDGTLARFRKSERPKYGFFVDHSVDAVSETLVFVGLGVSPFARLDVAVLGLVGYLLMSVYVYVRTCVDGTFKISYGGVGPTEMRILVVIANTAVFFLGNPTLSLAGVSLTALDWVIAVVATALGTVFLTQTLTHALALRKVGE